MTRAIAPRSVGRNHKPPPPLFDPARATSPESEKALLAGLLDLLTSDASKCRDILAGVSGEMLTIDNGADVLRAISEAATLDAPRIGDVMASLRRQSSRRGDDYQCVVQLVTDLVEDTFATGPAAARLTADAAAEVRALLARRKAADACVDLLQALQSPAWGATLAQLPGYSAEGAQSGQVLALRAHLPWWRYRQEKTTHSAQDLKPQKISSRPGK